MLGVGQDVVEHAKGVPPQGAMAKLQQERQKAPVPVPASAGPGPAPAAPAPVANVHRFGQDGLDGKYRANENEDDAGESDGSDSDSDDDTVAEVQRKIQTSKTVDTPNNQVAPSVAPKMARRDVEAPQVKSALPRPPIPQDRPSVSPSVSSSETQASTASQEQAQPTASSGVPDVAQTPVRSIFYLAFALLTPF